MKLPVLPASRLVPLVLASALAACAAAGPVLQTAALGFARNLISTAAHNFAPAYGNSLENLVVALAQDVAGVTFPEQVAQGPDTTYPGTTPDYGAYQTPGYSSEGYQSPAYGSPSTDAGQPGYDTGSADYGTPSPDYGTGGSATYGSSDPYQTPAYDSGSADYGQGQYSTPGGYAPPSYDGGYATPGTAPGGPVAAAETPTLDVALLTQRRDPSGQLRLQQIDNGDTLYDGRGDPGAGDKLKIYFRSGCYCHVYVIGIDGRGFVSQIFPDPESAAVNPVAPGQTQLLPSGTTWWGLDQYRGVETIYFIASRRQRPDIEAALEALKSQARTGRTDYRPVSQAAEIPLTRGLVKVQSAAPVAVPDTYGRTQTVTPATFSTAIANADLVLTRWFNHQ